MGKYFFAILFILFNIMSSSSQDIIKLVSEETIKCKVIKVGEKYIEYKRADNLDGPVYEIKKNEVQTIYYSNNTIDNFSKKDDKQKQDSITDIYSAKFGIGPTIGFNATMMFNSKISGKVTMGGGYNVGVASYLPFIKRKIGNLFVQPSLVYSREVVHLDYAYYDEGYTSYGYAIIDMSVREDVIINSLKAPVLLGYEFNLSKSLSVGPKIGVAYSRLFEKDYDDWNSLDLIEGMTLAILKKYRVDLGHQSNILRWDNNMNGKYKWTNFNINLSYLF